MSEYTMTVHLDGDAATAEERVREALADAGFGILSEIDVQAALQEKLGEDVGPYKILGACAPPLARQAIDMDADIGALLPCNVLVRAGGDGTVVVSAADPESMLALAGDDLADVAADAKRRLRTALDALS